MFFNLLFGGLFIIFTLSKLKQRGHAYVTRNQKRTISFG